MRRGLVPFGAALALIALALPAQAVDRNVLMEMMTNTS